MKEYCSILISDCLRIEEAGDVGEEANSFDGDWIIALSLEPHERTIPAKDCRTERNEQQR